MQTDPASQPPGAYVDVSPVAQMLGFMLPVMITQDLHARLLPDEVERDAGESYLERLAETLSLAYEAVQNERFDATRTDFQMHLHERDPAGAWCTSQLDLWCCRQGKGYVIGWPEDFWL
jgi:hypothetical protein